MTNILKALGILACLTGMAAGGIVGAWGVIMGSGTGWNLAGLVLFYGAALIGFGCIPAFGYAIWAIVRSFQPAGSGKPESPP